MPHNKNLMTHWGKETFLTVDGKPVKLKAGTAKRRKGGGRKPVYGPEVLASPRAIWAFFWYPCVGPKVRSSWPPRPGTDGLS
jgi:hypothetical protein